jgi:hypothetical protein
LEPLRRGAGESASGSPSQSQIVLSKTNAVLDASNIFDRGLAQNLILANAAAGGADERAKARAKLGAAAFSAHIIFICSDKT